MSQRFVPLLGLLACSAALAQTATVPANYHGPNVVGACFYVQNNAAFYAYPISISNYFRIDAERSFHKFVQTSTGQALPATCHWLTEQQYNASADKKFTAKNSAGQPVAATRLNWQYVPGSGGMNVATATPTGTPTPTANTAAATTATNTAASTTATTGTGIGSSVTDSVNSSKQAITASGATAVTDTMSSATTAVTGAMQSGMTHLLHHGKKTTDTPAAPAAQPSTDPTTAAPANAFAVTADAPASTAAAAAPAGGPNFVFCHLVASGSEYISDIFPTTDASDSTAQTAFWRQVGHQYKLSSIPFTNNVTCARSGSEAGATSARQTLMASAPTKGLKIVDTQWTWMGTGQ